MTGRTNINPREKVNNAKDVEVVAADQIRIGDTVYVMDHSPKDIYADGESALFRGSVGIAAFSPNGRILVLGGSLADGVKVYSVSGTALTHVQDITDKTLNGSIYAAAFSPDGKTLVLSGSFSAKAKVYAVSGTTVAFVQNIYDDTGTAALDEAVTAAAFSPDGRTLVLGGAFDGYAKVYAVSGTTITFVRNVASDAGAALDGAVYAAAFSPDGKWLVLGGYFRGMAKVYSISGTSIAFVSDLYADAGTAALSDLVEAAAFSPDSKALVIAGGFGGGAKAYSVSGAAVSFAGNIKAGDKGFASADCLTTVTFSPNGNTLILGGSFSGGAKAYSVSGTTMTYIRDISSDAGRTPLNNNVEAAAFSPDGKTLILGGIFKGKAKRYVMRPDSGLAEVEFESDIYDGAGTAALSSPVYTAAFSPDGKVLVLGGLFTGYAKIYSVSGISISFVCDLSASAGKNALNDYAMSAAFSPDGKLFILGGGFTGRAKVYSAAGTELTYVQDIYGNAGSAVLNDEVSAIAFSPDGKTLVLGGAFSGYAKAYTVSGTSVAYVGDIYADAEAVALDRSVDTATFSPDGAVLVLGGKFAGRAKAYSVSGTKITFLQDIHADAGSAALGGAVETAAFSPDGKNLVLGGDFVGKAKVYAVSGTMIAYTENIYADRSAAVLDDTVFSAAYSPDGKALLLGGDFTGNAKVYSVAGTKIAFVRELDIDNVSPRPNQVQAAVFSPCGEALILGGGFTGKAKVCSYRVPSIPENRVLAYPAHQGIAPLATAEHVLIGYSRKHIKAGGTGKVRTIAALQNESWAGGLSFSGTYANAGYFTEAGCGLNVDRESGRAFLTIQGGTNTAYANVVFRLLSAPHGIEMLTSQQFTHASNGAGSYYTCILAGVDRRIRVFVDFDLTNSTCGYVRASVTVV